MARIVSIQEGADGIAKAMTDDGSLLRFRMEYLPSEAVARLAGGPAESESEVLPIAAVEAAAACLAAEGAALRLLARAEQHRSGLQAKLAARKLPAAAITAALDRLELSGSLSDPRYAQAWIAQRLRRHAEGPRSLAAALAARGLDRDVVSTAVEEALSGEARVELIAAAAARLARREPDLSVVRERLFALGWRSAEIREALENLPGA